MSFIILVQVTTGPVMLAYATMEDRDAAVAGIRTAMDGGGMISISRTSGSVRNLINPAFITQVHTFDDYDTYRGYMRVIYSLPIPPQHDDEHESPDPEQTPWEKRGDFWKGDTDDN